MSVSSGRTGVPEIGTVVQRDASEKKCDRNPLIYHNKASARVLRHINHRLMGCGQCGEVSETNQNGDRNIRNEK